MQSIGKYERKRQAALVRTKIPKDSIKVRVLEDTIITLHTYSRDRSEFPFTTIPWNVIETCILPYLDCNDTIALARTTRQWYRRIANIASKKLAFEIGTFIEMYRRSYSRLADVLAKIDNFKDAYNKMTPMAIRCFADMKVRKWTSRFVYESRGYQSVESIADRLLDMFKRISKHGSLDMYKEFTILNHARLDSVYEDTITHLESRLKEFKDHMLNNGFIVVNVNLTAFRNTRRVPRINFNPVNRNSLVDHEIWCFANNYGKNIKYSDMHKIVILIEKFDIPGLKKIEPKFMGECLVKHGLAFRFDRPITP